jgi:hypothetical protein
LLRLIGGHGERPATGRAPIGINSADFLVNRLFRGGGAEGAPWALFLYKQQLFMVNDRYMPRFFMSASMQIAQ